MRICPQCKRILADDDYEERKEYHNRYVGVCRLCGYEGNWTEFLPV